MYYSVYRNSPLGDITVGCSDTGLNGLWFENQKYIDKTMPKDRQEKITPLIEMTFEWLEKYFDSAMPDVNKLPLQPYGGEFRLEVWRLICEIPYGQTATYSQIAKRLCKRMGKERMSAQAVGNAVGHNPIGIIIPCHRVIGSDGSLTGYAGGLDKKAWLLSHEGAIIPAVR